MAILREEMGEVLQAEGKMDRFGLFPFDSIEGKQYDNVADFQKECVDVGVALVLLQHVGLLSEHGTELSAMAMEKARKLARRFQHIDPEVWMKFATREL